jgi:hypothetical protein
VTREEWIADHVTRCTAAPARKYDSGKPTSAVHSVEYSRRKCAKNLWRKMQRETARRREVSAKAKEHGHGL